MLILIFKSAVDVKYVTVTLKSAVDVKYLNFHVLSDFK